MRIHLGLAVQGLRAFARCRLLPGAVGLMVLAAFAVATHSFVSDGGGGKEAAQVDGELYVADQPYADQPSRRFSLLDPATLQDVPDGAPLTLPGQGWLASADGSAVVIYERAWGAAEGAAGDAVTLVVRDRRTGSLRAHVDLPSEPGSIWLSHDGRRMVIQPRPPPSLSTTSLPRPRWEVYDVAAGQFVATVTGDGPGGADVADQTVIDAEARRLYYLVIPGAAREASGPRGVHVIAYDLDTGGEVGRSEVPQVLTGGWLTSRQVQAEAVGAELVPAMAVSPDGGTLAIVHADADRVTVIGARDLGIRRTVAFGPPTSPIPALSLWPEAVQAKGLWEASGRWAVFAPDGKHLYVWGTGNRIADDGGIISRWTGLMRVDLETGAQRAAALSGQPIDLVLPAPDGQSVYVFGPKSASAQGYTATTPYVLRRLDATSLAVLAEREFSGARRILLWPGRRDGQEG